MSILGLVLRNATLDDCMYQVFLDCKFNLLEKEVLVLPRFYDFPRASFSLFFDAFESNVYL